MFVKWFPAGMLQANCTVIGDEATKEAIAFDVGGDAAKVAKVIAKQGFKLSTIILTHMHFDHLLGVMELVDATGANVWAHKDDKDLGSDIPFQMSLFQMSPPSNFKPVVVDHWFENKAEISLGGKAIGTVIHTPGHSLGSCCFYFKDEALLISGDTLFAGGVGRSDLPGGNGRQLTASIKNHLLVLPDDTRVITGHGGETTIGTEKLSNPYVGSRGGMFSAFGGGL